VLVLREFCGPYAAISASLFAASSLRFGDFRPACVHGLGFRSDATSLPSDHDSARPALNLRDRQHSVADAAPVLWTVAGHSLQGCLRLSPSRFNEVRPEFFRGFIVCVPAARGSADDVGAIAANLFCGFVVALSMRSGQSFFRGFVVCLLPLAIRPTPYALCTQLERDFVRGFAKSCTRSIASCCTRSCRRGCRWYLVCVPAAHGDS
jgi:hypothetical protein